MEAGSWGNISFYEQNEQRTSNAPARLARAKDSDHLPLNLPLLVPGALVNHNGIHFSIGGLQSHLILLLEEPLQRRTAAGPALQMRRHDNIAVLTGPLRSNDDVITITDTLLDHRPSTNH